MVESISDPANMARYCVSPVIIYYIIPISIFSTTQGSFIATETVSPRQHI
jgi:hypothetical protein